MNEPRPLHRLFGLTWMDFFQGTSITVETELDLSAKQQFIDVVIIRRGSEPPPRRMPDGFEELAAHNLITFKSHQESLDSWTLHELIGHYVNYRKQSSPSLDELLPTSDYRMFAVTARFPAGLAAATTLTKLSPGVYDVQAIALPIRLIVAGQLPKEEHNVILHLFSAKDDLLRYSRGHYRPFSLESSSVLFELLEVYDEDREMADKLREFVEQTKKKFLENLTPEERVAGLPPEERLKGLTVEEQLQALSPEAKEALNRRFKQKGAETNGN